MHTIKLERYGCVFYYKADNMAAAELLVSMLREFIGQTGAVELL